MVPLGASASRVIPYSRCQTAQSSSFPRAFLRPGFASSSPPPEPRPRGRGAPRGRRGWTCDRASKARRHDSEARGVPRHRTAPLGAPPWRFRPGARVPSLAFPAPSAGAPRRPRIMPGGPGPRTSRVLRLRAAVAGRTPTPPVGSSPEAAPLSEDGWILLPQARVVVKNQLFVARRSTHATARAKSRLGKPAGVDSFGFLALTQSEI